MKNKIWKLALVFIALTCLWACVDGTDEPAPKFPDQEVPAFAKRFGG